MCADVITLVAKLQRDNLVHFCNCLILIGKLQLPAGVDHNFRSSGNDLYRRQGLFRKVQIVTLFGHRHALSCSCQHEFTLMITSRRAKLVDKQRPINIKFTLGIFFLPPKTSQFSHTFMLD